MIKFLSLAAAVACLGIAAVAGAQTAPQTKLDIALRLQNVEFQNPTDDCPYGVATFDLADESNHSVGAGTACFKSLEGCDPFVPGCRDTASAVFTLSLEGGSITAPVTLRELALSYQTLLQVGSGKISGGTGNFAGATGLIQGGGTVFFDDSGLHPTLVYRVLIRTHA